MKLPKPSPQYDPTDEAQTRALIEREVAKAYQAGKDVVIQPGQRAMLYSPNGSRWQLVASDAGVLSLVSA